MQVNHSVREYVDGQASTNSLESFRSLLKRGCHGTYHKKSVKHLGRYGLEFARRQKAREADTIIQMSWIDKDMIGKRLKYEELTAQGRLTGIFLLSE